ncbi:DMT family transporter [Desulfobaculum bizertense]|uniref:DMT family transporter n=1 Tax=Desulfobaculum bizertense TaxID=376490 RepID=UPI001F15E75B|nr:DMT family transporter [Desulfobaculum bizertense]UIJ38213.1 DMT family transporter [Desulfobaculum bizertense]
MHGLKSLRTHYVFGYVLIALAVLNWSGNFVAARAMANVFPPATFNVLRWLIATVVFLPFGIRPLWRERAVVLANLPVLFLVSLFGISLYDVLSFIAGSTTGALNMSLIATLSPVFTFIAAHFFLGEDLNRQTIVGILVSVVGVVTLVTNGDISRLAVLRFSTGDLLMLCVACMSAGYNVSIKRLAGKLSQSAMLMATFILGLLALCPMCFWELQNGASLPEMTVEIWEILLYLGIFASVLCYLFWNMAVSIIGAGKATLFYYTIPFCSGILAWYFLGEAVTYAQIMSGIMIFGGIIICLSAGSSTKTRPHKRIQSMRALRGESV